MVIIQASTVVPKDAPYFGRPGTAAPSSRPTWTPSAPSRRWGPVPEMPETVTISESKTYIYMYICIHTCVNIYACIHTYIHTYIHTSTYLHIYIEVYVYMYVGFLMLALQPLLKPLSFRWPEPTWPKVAGPIYVFRPQSTYRLYTWSPKNWFGAESQPTRPRESQSAQRPAILSLCEDGLILGTQKHVKDWPETFQQPHKRPLLYMGVFKNQVP